MLSTLLVWSAWSFIVLGSVLLLLALTNSVLILLTDHDEVDMVKRLFTAGIILVLSGSGLIAENVTLSVILLLSAFIIYWIGWQSFSKVCQWLFEHFWLMWSRYSVRKK